MHIIIIIRSNTIIITLINTIIIINAILMCIFRISIIRIRITNNIIINILIIMIIILIIESIIVDKEIITIIGIITITVINIIIEPTPDSQSEAYSSSDSNDPMNKRQICQHIGIYHDYIIATDVINITIAIKISIVSIQH